jgi:uncharacterized membrane protein
MASLMNLLRRFAADQRGNIAFMSVGGMTLAICCAALGVDVGTIAADRRKTQSAADIAAIVAASNLTNATNAARSAVTNNNYPATALTSVELGTYTADSSIPVQSRFVTPAVGTANAARVTVQTSTPLYFSKFFTGSNAFTIKTQAIAANTQIGSFAIGSRLASLNGGLLNSVLGSLLGTTLSLSVMDYQALLNARIDAFDFLSALSTRIGLTAATYDNVLNANVKVGDILAAALSTQQATNGGSTATTALSTISQAATSSTAKLTPLSLIDAGPYADLKVGTKPKTGVSLSLFDLLQATAGIANGTNQVNTGVNINLPGIASVQLIVQIGERPQGSSWVAVGNKGVSVHTAQTRVLLQVKLIGTGAASVVNLPVYVEVGSGTATLDKLSCGYPNINTSTVTLGVTPGVIDAWIANVSAADVKNVSTKPNPGPATLVDLGLITVAGKAHVGIGNTTPVSVDFSYADITAQTKKTVTNTNFTQSLIGSLLGDLNLTVTVIGLGIPIPGLGALVGGILSAATGSLDQLLVGVLSSLGVGIGQADVWVTGIRCDGAVLVN